MKYIEKNQKHKKTARQKWHSLIMTSIVGMLLLLSTWCLTSVVQTYQKINKVKAETTQVTDQLNNEKQIVSKLKQQRDLLHDNTYVAKLARSQYYMSKEGEIIFSMPEDNDSKQADELYRAYQEEQNKTK